MIQPEKEKFHPCKRGIIALKNIAGKAGFYFKAFKH